MSNIHGISDFRNPPKQSNAYKPQSNPGLVGPSQSRSINQNYSQNVSDSPFESQQSGISMMSAEPNPDGSPPSCGQRMFPRMKLYSVTSLISIVDFILFIITLIIGGSNYDGAFVRGNDMGGPSPTTLYHMGGVYSPDIQNGQIWRLFTAIFLHAGVLHILSNLFFQLRVGFTLELRWNPVKFFIIYIFTGISASLWSAVLNSNANSVSVGASGALFGIIGANITYLIYNYHQLLHSKQECYFIGFIIIITFLFGISSNVDNYAHLGGLISGLFIGMWLIPPLISRDSNKELLWKFIGIIGFFGLFLLFSLLLWVGKPAGKSIF